MITSEFLRRLKVARDAKVREIEHNLGRGGASGFDIYKGFVGRIQGLNDLDDLINEVNDKMEHEDD